MSVPRIIFTNTIRTSMRKLSVSRATSQTQSGQRSFHRLPASSSTSKGRSDLHKHHECSEIKVQQQVQEQLAKHKADREAATVCPLQWILIDEFIGTTSLGNSFFVQSSGLK
jgi:hypothetical protein